MVVFGLGLFAGCGDTPPPEPPVVRVSGRDFGMSGKTVYMQLSEGWGDTAEPVEEQVEGGSLTAPKANPIVDGAFGAEWKLQRNRRYTLAWDLRLDGFIDMDGDEECHLGIDLVFYHRLKQLGPGEHVEVMVSSQFDPRSIGCAGFGANHLLVEGVNIPADKTVHAVLLRERDNKIISTAQEMTKDGMLKIDWTGAIWAKEAYRVDMFVDMNDNGKCDDLDMVWRRASGALFPHGTGATLLVRVSGLDMPMVAACSSFPPPGPQ